MHHYHWSQFVADVLFLMMAHGAGPAAAPVSLERLERDLQPVSYEQVLRSLDMRTWEHTSHPNNGGK